MALKAIMIRKKLDDKIKEREAFEKEQTALEERRAEIETAINEASNEEEKEAVRAEVESFESDEKNRKERGEQIEEEIRNLEKELEEEEKKDERADDGSAETREENPTMETREIRTVAELVQRESVQSFLTEIRSAIKEKRGLTNAGLTIPTEIMPLLKGKVEAKSKLIDKVNFKVVAGTSRQTILGTIPEGVWTEMCGNLNELALVFNDVELDGYKVGGYIPICNAVVEDNDINLLNEVIDAISASLAIGLDKAIVYGKGIKMPLGIVTRLAQTSAPSDYSPTARTWADLHTSNIKTGTGATGLNLIKELISNSGIASSEYGNKPVWIMNHKTKTAILANTLDANANGAIVAGINNEMPVIGGEIVELNFVPDNNVIFGYGDDYTLAQRGVIRLEQSKECQFIQDNLVVKGVGRYDGQPAIAEAFVLMTITTDAPTTSVDFAPDVANISA